MKSENRYFPPKKWEQLSGSFRSLFTFETLGYSVQGNPIEVIRIGQGSIKVLMWSQMHGNESSTTRALVRLLQDFTTPEADSYFNQFQLAILPQLNPDGAQAYTRLNANNIDLNRDAQALSQPESLILKEFCDSFQPDYAFNLHGQRTIFGAGIDGNPATLSFLAPAGDSQKTITQARIKAMHLIADIHQDIIRDLPKGIGRYEDTFNINCVGDSLTSLGIPTVLFESGHYPLDYDRDRTVEFTHQALRSALHRIQNPIPRNDPAADYHQIPQNTKNWVDMLLDSVDVEVQGELFPNQQLALQYEEHLEGESVVFNPIFHAFATKVDLQAHQTLQLKPMAKAPIFRVEDQKSLDYNILLMDYS